MDIIDYISCTLQIKREIVFTVFTTIFIFILGQLISYVSKRLEEIKGLKDKEIYYFELLSLVPNPTLLQAKELQKYAKTLRDNEDENPRLVHMSHIHLNKLSGFPNDEAFKIWVRRKKGNVKSNVLLFNSLYDFIDIAQKRLESYPKIHYEYIEVLKNYQTEYDRNLDLILENLPQLRKNLSPKSQLLEVLDKIELAFDETDRTIRSNTYHIVVEPLIDQMAQDGEKLKTIDKSLLRCKQAFARCQETRKQFAKLFDDQAQKLENIAANISQILVNLKTLKNKPVFLPWWF